MSFYLLFFEYHVTYRQTMCNKSLIGKLHSSQSSCVWLLASYSLFSILMLLRGAYTVTRSRRVVGLLISLKASPILVSQPGCYQHYMEFCCCRSEMNRDMFQVASRRAPSAAPAGVQTTEKRRLARHDAHSDGQKECKNMTNRKV